MPHYRLDTDCMAQMPDGGVMSTNGIDAPQVFRAEVGSWENSGITAPVTAVTVGSTGSGDIVGDIVAYTRFIDRSGYPSSLSPVTEATIGGAEKTITGATNASPIVITSTGHGFSNGDTVRISQVYGNEAANGVFVAANVGANVFSLYEWPDGTVPVHGSGTYNSGGIAIEGVSQIDYSNVEAPTEARVVRRQILRSKEGDSSVLYVDVETSDLVSTSFSSTNNDDDLVEAVPLEDSTGHTMVDKTPPPNHKKFCAHHLGRMFLIGNEPYTQGAVSVTNGSATVTGLSTEWNSTTFDGRFFEVVGGTKIYTISNCTSETSITLSENYAGTTDPYAYYIIHNGRGERRQFYWSEPGEPEAWPIENTLTLEEDPGAGEITGIMPMASWVYFLAENRMYRFSFVNDPFLDGFSVKAARRGCINNRCWVQVEDAAYMMDQLGFHVFYGNEDAALGAQEVQDIFRPNSESKYKINWAGSRWFHALYDPGEATVRWFVSLDSCYTPRHAICFNKTYKRWWIEEYDFPISASCFGRMGGRPQSFLGTDGQKIMAPGLSPLDGSDVNNGTLYGDVYSAGINWITDSSANYASGLGGYYVQITNGAGKGQIRRIVSITGQRINVKNPWLVRPDSTSSYQIAGISWEWKSGWMSWVDSSNDKSMVRAVSIQYTALDTNAPCTLRVFRDMDDNPEDWGGSETTFNEANGIMLVPGDPTTDLSIDLSRENGFVFQRFDGTLDWYTHGPRFVAVGLMGVTREAQHALLRVTVEGAKD